MLYNNSTIQFLKGGTFMQLNINEPVNPVEVEPAFLHNIYTLSYVTCACCGKKIVNDNDGVVFDNPRRPDAYTYIPNHFGDVDFDLRHLPEDDFEGATFVPTISPVDDDEGLYWKSYCKPCWEKLKSKSDEYIYNNTGESDCE